MPWAILGAAVLSSIPLAFVLYLTAPQPGNRGVNCGGIGFGESPCGWDAVGLSYIILGIPFLAIVLITLLLLEAAGPRAQRARIGLCTLAIVIPWALAVAALFESN